MTKRKEIPWIHIVRVLACFMVVCLHVSTAADAYPLSHLDSAFKHIVYIATKPCVPLFFMVTGFLILPYKNGEDLWAFYKKRIPRVLYPLLVWGVVYAVLPYTLGMTEWQMMVKEVLLSPIKQPDYFGGILWYLDILIGIYLFIPFLTDRIYNNRTFLKTYLIVWVVSSIVLIIKAHVPNVFGENHWEHVFDMFLYFSGYLGFLLFGYAVRTCGEPLSLFVSKRYGGAKSKYLVLLVLAIIASYFIGGLIKSFLAIGTIGITVCVFMLIQDVRIDVSGKCYALIKHISALSFGIYLCHMFVLKLLSENIYKYCSASFIYQIVAMIITFAGAYLMSWLISKLPFKKYIIG